MIKQIKAMCVIKSTKKKKKRKKYVISTSIALFIGEWWMRGHTFFLCLFENIKRSRAMKIDYL